MNGLDPKIFESPTVLILALAALIDALRRLIQSVKSVDRTLPKSFWPKLAQILNRAIKCIIQEITPPNPSPMVTKAALVIIAAVFYVLVLDCLCLLSVDGILVATSDAAAWRKLLGAGALFVIVLAGRFCFTQGERLRDELRATSRVLW